MGRKKKEEGADGDQDQDQDQDSSKEGEKKKKKKFKEDPFMPPYDPDLFVTEDSLTDPESDSSETSQFVILVRPPPSPSLASN